MMTLMLLVLGCTTVGDAPFQAGLTAIRSGDGTGALKGFEAALAEGARDPAVYHGLGNALYRLGHEGEAAAAWRRGLALDPRNGDIAANLDHARKSFTDRIEPPAMHRGAFFWQSFLSPLESGLMAALALAFGLWIGVWGRLQSLRGRGGLASNTRLVAGVSALVGLVLFASTLDAVSQRQGAVVTVAELEVRSALGPSGVSLFVLHEGAEVAIEDATNTHRLLVLSDGRKGWVNATALRSTNPAHPFVFSR
jgi:tetratricopeptide (TPR) repeat protein